jgi:hypothetical protein
MSMAKNQLFEHLNPMPFEATGGHQPGPITFKSEFLPPNGLGTDSLASGSDIQRPSTTKQYS